ncbi:hypothetical protein ACP275_14G019100 [Erythranthe tilingii]
MKFQYYFWFIIQTTIVVSVSSSTTLNYRVEGCSLVGIDLQNCLVPNPKTIDSCCTVLNQAIKAGYYCICSLLSLSNNNNNNYYYYYNNYYNNNYPFIANEIALSFSNCYLSLPPLTHCHEPPRPIVSTAPPVAALAPPFNPVLVPPELPRGDGPFVPNLPRKGNTDNPPLNNLNSSIVGSSVPKTSIQYERSDRVKSDGVDVKMLMHSRKLFMVVITTVLACILHEKF